MKSLKLLHPALSFLVLAAVPAGPVLLWFLWYSQVDLLWDALFPLAQLLTNSESAGAWLRKALAEGGPTPYPSLSIALIAWLIACSGATAIMTFRPVIAGFPVPRFLPCGISLGIVGLASWSLDGYALDWFLQFAILLVGTITMVGCLSAAEAAGFVKVLGAMLVCVCCGGLVSSYRFVDWYGNLIGLICASVLLVNGLILLRGILHREIRRDESALAMAVLVAYLAFGVVVMVGVGCLYYEHANNPSLFHNWTVGTAAEGMVAPW